MPNDSDEGDLGIYAETVNFYLVSKYTKLNFNEIRELQIDDFLQYQRDALIMNKMQTSEGQQYLKEYVTLHNKKTDKKALERLVGGGTDG
ncbi:MAG TPA: hypothetical protein DCM01_07625 [Dielma fastidiosa]|jgi:hypothetical protein|nr:hypothetical protein [Dielma fastidiosa]